MNRTQGAHPDPSLLVSVCIFLASLIAIKAPGTGLGILAGPALLLAAACLLASGLVTLRDPAHVHSLLPLLGTCGWILLLPSQCCRAANAV